MCGAEEEVCSNKGLHHILGNDDSDEKDIET
jgi:hypothetical protein